ncbi:Leucyl tRNA synthetase [Fasciola gigantica]|uniref:leucine--tRNA ligase n=1 Tax=Fasciola gigantica TaxID=46835 RepID=A0A504YSD9_FASGI|nr:Leucyl tRNA synthetase [Fasciola gigantica]
MREQMESTMLLSLDWSREISTCSSDYYKWTQWIFLKLFEAGLVYRRSAYVNWDPIDQTVLADELVDAQGRSWRSGAVVLRKPLCQWYFRSSAYSQSLLDGLKEIEGNQWRDVIQMQRGWLGKLDGTQIEFDVTSPSPECERDLNSSRKLIVFHGAVDIAEVDSRKLCVMSSVAASIWPERLAIWAVHPFTGRLIPMIRQPEIHLPLSVAFPDFVRTVFDAQSEALAKIVDLPSAPASISPSKPINDHDLSSNPVLVTPVSELNGLRIEEATESSMQLLKKAGRGGFWSSESRSDWLVSRQRYWGTPIPIVHCDSCGAVPVPENQLPVHLPPLKQTFKRGTIPLRDNTEWRRAVCPKCGGPADRETDTLDTFVDSSWYYVRFLDPNNSTSICDPEFAKAGLPVDVYVGGIEHAIRHLFYARFIAHFLHDLGVISCREPFLRFLPVGLVLGHTFTEPHSGRYVTPTQVDRQESKPGHIVWTERGTGQPLTMQWDKMSKSKLNGVDPSGVVERHGIEVVRLTMLANVGPHRARKWEENDGIMRGIIAWRFKLIRLGENLIEWSRDQASNNGWQLMIGPDQDPLWYAKNGKGRSQFCITHENTLNLVNSYYNDTFVLSAAISRLQETTELLRTKPVLDQQFPVFSDIVADAEVGNSSLEPAAQQTSQ